MTRFIVINMQVGIIMYLPTSDARQRKEITEEFFNYRSKTQTNLWDGYSAYEHWAKIEVRTFTA
ncbi:Os12g0139600 [Oryza sativa Japonica Group]|nr:Os12g0139600 [Oryza sativa Japonica Group]|eukprot:NP_001066120.2 Os12g0139600 [Oryza sativa Japonica Group]